MTNRKRTTNRDVLCLADQPIAMGELARLTGRHFSSICRSARRLAKAGYVTLQRNIDGKLTLTITPAGVAARDSSLPNIFPQESAPREDDPEQIADRKRQVDAGHTAKLQTSQQRKSPSVAYALADAVAYYLREWHDAMAGRRRWSFRVVLVRPEAR